MGYQQPDRKFGAGYKPASDHHHAEFSDADLLEDIASKFHGQSGRKDESKSAADRTANVSDDEQPTGDRKRGKPLKDGERK
jgi:hypothetical protein